MSICKADTTSQNTAEKGNTNSQQHPVDDQKAATAQRDANQQSPSGTSSGTTAGDVSSVHSLEQLRVQEAQQIATAGFIHKFPHEILYRVFEHMGFYDFATATLVCSAWRTILMESIWPQRQEEFFALYPLVELSSSDRAAFVDWLRSGRTCGASSGNLAHLQARLNTAGHLSYRQEVRNFTVLEGSTPQVLLGIAQRVATLRELRICSVISPYKYDDLFRHLASCHELKKLRFSGNLSPRPLTNFDRQLSITYISINHIHPPRIRTTAHIDFLKQLLLLCPRLRDFVLTPRSYWRGAIQQILQACPSGLSTFVFVTDDYTSLYDLGLTTHALQKLSITMDNLYVDAFDLADAIEMIADSLGFLRLTFPPPSNFNPQPGAISSLAGSLQHCHKLHTVDIEGSSITNETLMALSTIPKLETVCFTFKPWLSQTDAAPQGFLKFFTQTDASSIKRIDLNNCSDCIDNQVLSSLLGFSNLERLKITENFDIEHVYDDQKLKDVAQKIIASNPKLKVIESTDAEILFHLEVESSVGQ